MNDLAGFVLSLAGGISVGFSMWSLKWARTWHWENFWLFYSLFSLIIFPFGLAFSLLPHLAAAYESLTLNQIMLPLTLGACWGLAQLGAGICIRSLGMAVTGAVLNGIGAAVGTVLPLIWLHRESTLASSGLLILTGTALMMAGATFCGWSGYLREAEVRERNLGSGFGEEEIAMRQESIGRGAYLLTLAVAVLSGVLSALLNVSLAYGGAILQAAQAHGGQPAWAPFAVWPIALLGGSLVNLAYSAYLLSKNRTWDKFRGSSVKEFFNPVLAAFLWMAGIAIYSSGTTFLGRLGVSIGYAVYAISLILSGQFVGVVTGEWRLMKPRTYALFVLGIGFLVLAVLAIGTSKYMQV